MGKIIVQNILILICLILVQVLICNHIMLFNIVMVFVFIYVVISLPLNLSTGWLLTWAFFSGLVVDIFSNTVGVNSLACTLLAIIKRPVFYAYIPKDDRTKNIEPSLATVGFGVYGKYLFTMTAAYCLMVFTIEYLSFADIEEILIMGMASAVFTFLILLGIDSLITNSEKRL